MASPFPDAAPNAEEEVFGLVADSFELPSELKIGIAYDVLQGRNEQHHLIVSLDGIHPNFAGDRINFGVEAKVSKFLFGRVGYSAADQSDFVEGFSGGGLHFNLNTVGLRLDYSYSDMSELGNTQRFTLGLAF